MRCILYMKTKFFFFIQSETLEQVTKKEYLVLIILSLIAIILKKGESQLARLLMLSIKIHFENYEILGKSASQVVLPG